MEINLTSVDDHYHITIKNHGHPISEERLTTFFEKFNSDHSTKRGGTGLGTSYAHLVTIAHGGDIKVESSAKEGTRVTVSLPKGKNPKLNREA